jgi:hypothetical protein
VAPTLLRCYTFLLPQPANMATSMSQLALWQRREPHLQGSDQAVTDKEQPVASP